MNAKKVSKCHTAKEPVVRSLITGQSLAIERP